MNTVLSSSEITGRTCRSLVDGVPFNFLKVFEAAVVLVTISPNTAIPPAFVNKVKKLLTGNILVARSFRLAFIFNLASANLS